MDEDSAQSTSTEHTLLDLHSLRNRPNYSSPKVNQIQTPSECFEFLSAILDNVDIEACSDDSLIATLNAQDALYWKSEEYLCYKQTISPLDVDQLLDITDQVGIKCPECKERDCSYKLVQTRSADEGMTAMCSCRKCFNSWAIKM